MNTRKAIDAFNSLIVINNDRIEGYRIASNEIEDADLKLFFKVLGQTSIECRKELIEEVKKLGGIPDEGTKNCGKFFRAWMEVKAALTGNDRRAILNSCEYGEDVALEIYKNVLIQEVHEINSHGVSGCKLQALPSSVSMWTSNLKLLSTRASILSSVMPQSPPIFSFIMSPCFTP